MEKKKNEKTNPEIKYGNFFPCLVLFFKLKNFFIKMEHSIYLPNDIHHLKLIRKIKKIIGEKILSMLIKYIR